MEGLVGRSVCHDVCDHGGYVVKDGSGRDAECTDVPARGPLIAGAVFYGLPFEPVMCAIDFDRKFGRGAVEVENIDTGRVLLAELQTVRAGPQGAPEDDFGEAKFSAEAAAAQDGAAWTG